MRTIRERMAAVARHLNVELPAEVLENMVALLARIEQNLAWPEWEHDQPVSDPDRPVTPVQREGAGISAVVEAALGRARLVSEGGAYTYIDAKGARATARAMDLSAPHTPLAGMTLAIKDLMAVAGQPVGAASSVRQDAPIALRDAPVVAALRNAGAIVIGTTSLHEFAFGTTGINDYLGTTPNPHDPTRVAGGSSSGSAVAVAEGSARVAIGTDTGGSVRIPASLCGVVGFKPAFGTYPIAGVFPLSPSLDHVGLLARTVGDIQTVHSHLARPVSGEYQPTRVGVVRAELEKCEPIVRQRVETVLQRLTDRGCSLVDVDQSWPGGEKTFAVSTAIMFSEAAAVHKIELQRDATRYGADVRHRLLQGLAISAADYITALQVRQPLKTQVHTTLTGVDCVIGPTVGLVAPKLDEGRDPALSGRLVAFTRLGNLTGIPALSLPIPGPGLPVGLQILANRNEQTLKIAAFLERLLAE